MGRHKKGFRYQSDTFERMQKEHSISLLLPFRYTLLKLKIKHLERKIWRCKYGN